MPGRASQYQPALAWLVGVERRCRGADSSFGTRVEACAGQLGTKKLPISVAFRRILCTDEAHFAFPYESSIGSDDPSEALAGVDPRRDHS